ncbi:hypothetical protein XarbCFBP7697_19960 [Xanthomonas arboricola]|uniref:hypothetical protein n=1 Tax=Xanthomonas arboricola TaxID=56448 RepID=UPI000CEE7510|nr:hypothetical protein [Xanthomonas arboricola]PPU43519.1 hypothetical protein XarbCFBP7697_19960 [Xanthomonas arboricola]
MLFIILMSEHDFFSYDIFEVGGFGMMVFYATTELMIILSGLMLFGFFIPLAARMKTGRTPWSDLRPILVLNIFCWLALATVIFDRGWKTEQHFFPLVLSALAALYISAALHAPRRLKIRSAIGLIGIMVLFAAIYPKPMVDLLAKGLRAYGVGGEIPVQIVYQDGEKTRGKLVFLSPENAYVISMSDGISLSTIRRSATREITIMRHSPRSD